MHEFYIYDVELGGQVEENEINALGPYEMRAVRMDENATHFKICADQAGLIGLLRHLHGRGFVLLSITRAHS